MEDIINDPSTFFQHVFNGLSISGIYILIALGITLVFGLTRLVNFAHGQFMVLGGFLAFSLVDNGMSYWLAMPVAGVMVGVMAGIMDLGVFRRNLDRPINGLIVTLGLVIALQAITVEGWSTEQYKIESPVSGVWSPTLPGLDDPIRITQERALLLGISLALVVALFLLLGRTDLGRSMRAVAENRYAASLLGVNVGLSILATFMVGTGMAAVGGALLGIIFPFTAFFGASFLIKGIAVAMVGGLGSVEGVLVAGLALGMVETLGTAYGIDIGIYEFGPLWRDGYAFLLMIAILLWRPQGLFRGVGGGL
ncbi:MAG TPA: branched-chain amino acid ABC transporter permease [Dehalococcoidia bacterium]|nr:branched-chain amino acid ABC transporter permease [Dehalococcoidia bacterium]